MIEAQLGRILDALGYQGAIALVGGVMINTPEVYDDRFDVRTAAERVGGLERSWRERPVNKP